MAKPLVSILMGSDSDLPVMEGASKLLTSLNIPHEMTISSAHRTPERTLKIAKTAERRGVKVIIAGAGMAAHLAGVIASATPLPVIGVPLASGSLNGQDALLSTVQMPPGMPVATVAIGGAKNAALLAAQILATSNKRIAAKVKAFRRTQARQVDAKARKLANSKK
jgi:phosphoribosylaminoimidazole carboxylase PurE protein